MNASHLLFIACCLLFISCGSDYSPKPRGYYRIDLPEKKYKHYSGACNYEFDYPVYAEVWPDSSRDTKPCWNNIVFPTLNGRLHLSYYTIQSEEMFGELIEDSRRLAFKHTVKAEGIDESRITNAKEKVYGLYYNIEGNTASSVQFFLTDSNKHFLRGALYFYAEPRQDSIQPVLNFVKKDIDVMLKSFKWK
jgi:gliding motility-associated lipoprotein GldD